MRINYYWVYFVWLSSCCCCNFCSYCLSCAKKPVVATTGGKEHCVMSRLSHMLSAPPPNLTVGCEKKKVPLFGSIFGRALLIIERASAWDSPWVFIKYAHTSVALLDTPAALVQNKKRKTLESVVHATTRVTLDLPVDKHWAVFDCFIDELAALFKIALYIFNVAVYDRHF